MRVRRPELTLRAPDWVDEEELPALYRGAAVFAYPSLYEGFGARRADPLSSEALAAAIEGALVERRDALREGARPHSALHLASLR